MIFSPKLLRIRGLRGVAGRAFTMNHGDVLELPVEQARELVSAGHAELAPDAPLGAAPTPQLPHECPYCTGRYGYFTGRCPYCGGPVL